MAKKKVVETKQDVVGLDRKEFAKALSIASLCTETSNILPILSKVAFTDRKILAFNGVQGIVVDFNHGLSEFCVEGQILTKLVTSYESEKVQIIENKVDNGKSLVTSIKVDNAVLGTVNINDFVFQIVASDRPITIALDVEKINILTQLLESASNDKIDDSLNGITIYFTPEDTTLYASDGKRIAMDKVAVAYGETQVILPYQFCKLITSFKEGLLFINPDERYAVAEFEGVKVHTQLPDSRYVLDFPAMVKEYVDVSLMTQPPTELRTNVKRAMMVVGKGNFIIVKGDGKDLTLISDSPNVQLTETVKLGISLPTFERKITTGILSDFFNSVAKFTVVKDKDEDFIFVGKSGETFMLMASTVKV